MIKYLIITTVATLGFLGLYRLTDIRIFKHLSYAAAVVWCVCEIIAGIKYGMEL